MSTVGAGAVVAAGTVGAGAAIGALAIAGTVVIGGGILIGRGLMWCGEKMEQSYQNACQEWTDLKEAARAESRANVQEISTYLTTQLDRLTADAFLVAPQPLALVESQDVRDALARARQALIASNTLAQDKADAEKAVLVTRLTTEIKSARGVLPADKIVQAENALHGTTQDMRDALTSLEKAWNTAVENQARQNYYLRQAQQILSVVATQLSVIDTMLQDAGTTRDAFLVQQRRDIAARVQEAHDYLDINAKQALEKAREVQRAVAPLMEAASARELDVWEANRTRVNAIRGTLNALATMVKEAEELSLVPPQRLNQLTQRIDAAKSEANVLLQGNVPDMQRRVVRLAQRADLLKEEVFAEVKGSQQQTVTNTIQTTLAELGFHSTAGEQLVIQRNGDTMRVEAMIAKGTSGEQHDDKVVTFDVTRDGQVLYDFSGYVGSSCVEDARRVFVALRNKGMFILDENGLEQLEQLPAASITEQSLNELQVKISPNKSQAELAEALKGVLQKMYPAVQESAMGGFIELEAFTGQHGYRVVLAPEGEYEVFKNAQDISEDTRDVVTAEAQRITQVMQENNEQQQQAKKSRPYMKKGNMQRLG